MKNVTSRAAMRRRIAACTIAVAGLALGACQTVTLSDMNPFSGSDAPQPCPPAAALADAASITEFGRGNARDDSNVLHSAAIQRTLFDCQVVAGQVSGRVAVAGTLTLGRKGKAGDISLPIFIALTRNGSDVISKRFETVDVTVDRGATTAEFEKVIPDYTFNLGGGESTLSYEVLSGFNLTPDQIAYNRKKLGG